MTDKKKILFIINPVSGVGRQKAVEKALSDHLDLSVFDYRIAYTEYKQHAVSIAKEAADNKTDVIVAVGGDGSVNEVARRLINSNTVMGIIPAGSGNGLARHLKIPTNIKQAIEILNRNKVISIDTGTMNGKIFISLAGLGYDALVAEKFASGKRRGFWKYLQLVISEFFRYSPLEYSIKTEGGVIKRKALLISFANAGQFGYNAVISPSASVNDGFIDICIIKNISALRAVLMAHRLFLKSIDKSKSVEIFKVKEAEITCESPASSHIDGDPDIRTTKAHIKIQPKSLNIIVP